MRLNVLYVTDDNFVMQTGVSVFSLLENNKDIEDICIYIAIDHVHKENIEKLKQTIHSFNRKVEFIDIEKYISFLHEVGKKGKGHWPLSVYIRLFVDKILEPYSIDKILYLDGDTIVYGSLNRLGQIEFNQKEVCAAVCVGLPPKQKKYIGLSSECRYFNSGVLWIDINHWKEQECYKKICSHLESNQIDYPIVDQDIINIVLQGQIHTLPMNYNTFAWFGKYTYYERRKMMPYLSENKWYSYEEYVSSYKKEGPIIIHYNDAIPGKPWIYDSIIPFKNIWILYKNKTIWKCEDQKKVKRKGLMKIAYFFYRFFPNNLYIIIWRIWLIIRNLLCIV